MLPTLRRENRAVSPFDLMDEDFSRMLRRWWGDAEPATFGTYPVDIREDEGHIYIDADLPGFTKDQVDITLENGVLTIAAQRKEETEDSRKGQVHLRERHITKVARRFSIPNAVDEQHVQAQLQDGVLHVTLNKREEVKPRKIEVK